MIYQNTLSQDPVVRTITVSIQVCKVEIEQLPGALETSTVSLLPNSTDQSMTLAGLDSQGRPRDSQQSPVTRSTEAEQRDLPPQENLAEQALCHSRFSALMRPLCSGTPVQRNQKAKQAQKHM